MSAAAGRSILRRESFFGRFALQLAAPVSRTISLALRALPRAAALRLRHRLEWLHGEPELRLVPQLCDPARLALDVGANQGFYSTVMRRHARLCHAFEPNPEYAWIYREVLPGVVLHVAALSDEAGRARFRIPVVDAVAYAGWGTLEDTPVFAGRKTREFEVELQRLDDLGLDPVGLIKIDVEGHEMAVLRGGRETIRRDRPAILLEAEERHRPGVLGELFEWMEAAGYRGFVLRGGALAPLAGFDPARDQAVVADGSFGGRIDPERYLRNFLFLATEAQARRLGLEAL